MKRAFFSSQFTRRGKLTSLLLLMLSLSVHAGNQGGGVIIGGDGNGGGGDRVDIEIGDGNGGGNGGGGGIIIGGGDGNGGSEVGIDGGGGGVIIGGGGNGGGNGGGGVVIGGGGNGGGGSIVLSPDACRDEGIRQRFRSECNTLLNSAGSTTVVLQGNRSSGLYTRNTNILELCARMDPQVQLRCIDRATAQFQGGDGDCIECFMARRNALIQDNGPSETAEIISALAPVGVAAFGALGTWFQADAYRDGTQAQANAYLNAARYGEQQCTLRFNNYTSYLETVEHPPGPDSLENFQCNNQGLNNYPGFNGNMPNGYGWFGNPLIGGGYTQGFLNGMAGPQLGQPFGAQQAGPFGSSAFYGNPYQNPYQTPFQQPMMMGGVQPGFNMQLGMMYGNQNVPYQPFYGPSQGVMPFNNGAGSYWNATGGWGNQTFNPTAFQNPYNSWNNNGFNNNGFNNFANNPYGGLVAQNQALYRNQMASSATQNYLQSRYGGYGSFGNTGFPYQNYNGNYGGYYGNAPYSPNNMNLQFGFGINGMFGR